MTDSKHHSPEVSSLVGQTYRPRSSEELAEAIEQAFGFRGDITLELSSGVSIEGYVFNRQGTGPAPNLQIFPKNQSEVMTIQYDQIVTIAFTGEDTASGKSWDAWIAKKESQRRAEAEHAAESSRVRGHL